MSPEYTIDHIAETVLPPDESWQAARQLGKYMVRHMQSTHTSEDAHYFHIEGPEIDEMLCGVSEQPDLTGEVVVTMRQAYGTWLASREAGLSDWRTRRTMPLFRGTYVGFHVMHAETAQSLLQLALPVNPMAGHMMRHGYSTTHTGLPFQITEAMHRYNKGDTSFEPRRVQAAAWLTRHIITNNVAPSYFLLSPEEQRAFEDKYFPYQDVFVTGGGGKTTRKRARPQPQRRPFLI